MSKFWTWFLWILVALVMVAMVVIWIIPEPVREGDATPGEREVVATRVREVQSELSHVKVDKVKAHRKHVVEVNATWTGKNPPAIKDRSIWGQEADRVAVLIARDYLPEGWQVNVALWYRRLPRGIAGRVAGANPEGGPAPLFRDRAPSPVSVPDQ